jgi:hypothetical protein
MGVRNIQVGVDSECGGEVAGAVGQIAAEEIAIIEIPVRAGKRNWLWCLVKRILIALGDHRLEFLP